MYLGAAFVGLLSFFDQSIQKKNLQFGVNKNNNSMVMKSNEDGLKTTNVDDGNLNADLSKRVLMKTCQMEWTRTASTAKVERKRVFRAGPQESGAVTSIVRFLPNTSFPLHPHPQGEEIFVLEGKFIDERGIHGPGVFLFNPEGFQHSPSTDDDGNLIFVRLRQYPNDIRNHYPPRTQSAIDTNTLTWVPMKGNNEGVFEKVLYPTHSHSDDANSVNDQSCYPERQWLEKWENDLVKPKPTIVGENGLEIFVVEGTLSDSLDTYRKGDWLRLPMNTVFDGKPTSPDGCILLCKSGGFQYAIPEDIISDKPKE